MSATQSVSLSPSFSHAHAHTHIRPPTHNTHTQAWIHTTREVAESWTLAQKYPMRVLISSDVADDSDSEGAAATATLDSLGLVPNAALIFRVDD